MRRLLGLFQSNWISAVGTSLTTLAFLAMVTGYVLNSLGAWTSPYQGLIILALLAVFVLGLVLIPVGLVVFRKTLRERLRTRELKASQILFWLGGLTLVNFAVVGVAGSRGAHHMGSVQFCGTACHQVMQPEYDTYFTSSHAGIECVACHVGPGATWYLKSKLNGARQAWMTLTGTWSAPIETPVHDLRSADETCGECHSPSRYVPERLSVRHHFGDDGTRSTDTLLLKVGGQEPDGTAEGIHWHAHPGTEVTYVHTDEDRMEIPWVQVRRSDGSLSTFTAEGVDPAAPPAGTLRRMDCIDCHNRPTHQFHGLDEAVDRSLASGALDAALPSIVPASKSVLQAKHARASAGESIREGLARFYADAALDPAPSAADLDAAGRVLTDVWLRNVYPERGVDWGTYPSLAGHAGCLRCHDGEHADPSGEVITFDCDACHTVLGMQETEPEVLEVLGLGGTR
jgi:hypothetical protein